MLAVPAEYLLTKRQPRKREREGRQADMMQNQQA